MKEPLIAANSGQNRLTLLETPNTTSDPMYYESIFVCPRIKLIPEAQSDEAFCHQNVIANPLQPRSLNLDVRSLWMRLIMAADLPGLRSVSIVARCKRCQRSKNATTLCESRGLLPIDIGWQSGSG